MGPGCEGLVAAEVFDVVMGKLASWSSFEFFHLVEVPNALKDESPNTQRIFLYLLRYGYIVEDWRGSCGVLAGSEPQKK